MRRRAFVLMTGAMLAVPHAARSATLTTADAFARLFTAPRIKAAWFAPPFAAQVPPDRVQAIVADIVGALGPYRSIAPNGSRFTVTFARGTVQAEGTLNAGGAFRSLLISRMQSGTVASRLAGLFGADEIPAAWFSVKFLSEVPIDRVRAIVTTLKAQNGAFTGIAPAQDGSYDITFAHATDSATAFLDADEKIAGLIVGPK